MPGHNATFAASLPAGLTEPRLCNLQGFGRVKQKIEEGGIVAQEIQTSGLERFLPIQAPGTPQGSESRAYPDDVRSCCASKNLPPKPPW